MISPHCQVSIAYSGLYSPQPSCSGGREGGEGGGGTWRGRVPTDFEKNWRDSRGETEWSYKKKKNSLAETTQHIARQRGKNTVGAKRGPPNAPQVQNADGYMILGRNIWNQDWLGLAKQILIRFSKLLRSSTALELIVLP